MNSRKTKIILVLVILLTAFVCTGFVYEYILIQNMKSHTLDLQTELISEKESLDSFNSLVKTTSNIKEDSEKANKFFIKKDEIANFLDVVEGIASSTQTDVSIKSVGEKKIQDSAVLSLNIGVTGSYKNVYYTLSLLQELPYQTEIQKIKLYVNNAETGKELKENRWSADIEMVGIML